MAAKSLLAESTGNFLRKDASRLCRYPAGQKFCQNCSISPRFRDKRVFAIKAEIQDGHQKWRENDFWEKSPVDSANTLWVKNFVKITRSRDNAFLRFMQKLKMAAKSGGKMIFEESCQKTLQIPCGSKISLKLLYLTLFPR